MKLFLPLFVLSVIHVAGQTTPRSGMFSSASSKSVVSLVFQTSGTSSTPLSPGYGSGFFIPKKSVVTSVINDVELETIKTYPNPASTVVTLEFQRPVHTIKIFDIKGNVSYQSNEETSNLTIDVTRLVSGFYRVVAIGNIDQYVSTFTVSK